jgi:F-type H+-transporting ATPase subunit epsilon
MQLTIVAPCGVLCHTTVEKVSLPGALGAFTVLPGHAPLIARLTAGEIVYFTGWDEHRQIIKSGFVKVLKDKIEVCVESPDEQPRKQMEYVSD